MESQRVILWFFAALLSACSAASPEATLPLASASTAPVAQSAAPATAPREIACTPDARTPKSGHRATGVQRLAERKYQPAINAFDLALDEKPNDLGAFTLHAVAEAEVAGVRADAARLFLRLKPSKVEPVPPPRKLLVPADRGPSVTVKEAKQEKHGGDWLAWAERAGFKWALGFGASDDAQSTFADMFGELSLVGSYMDGDVMIARYGQATIVMRHDAVGLRAVDFDKQLLETFRASVVGGAPDSIFPEVRYAAVVGSTLLVELTHEGDGANVKADGALLAYDLELDKVRWVSDLRLANAHSFFVTGKHAVVAFDDSNATTINVVDIATGEAVAKESLPFAADYLLGRGKTFHVAAGDKVVTYEISLAAERPQQKLGQTLSLPARTQPSVIVPMACFLGNALVALDQRDPKALAALAAQLPDTSGTAKVLFAAAEFLTARESGTAGLDLTEHQPKPVAYVDGPLVLKGGPKLATVTRRAVAAKDPLVEPPKPPFPQGPRQLYATKRYDLYPQRYGIGTIHGAYAAGKELALLYGNRYVVMIAGDEVKRVFDLLPLLGPGAAGSKSATSFSTVVEGVLYAVVSPTGRYGNSGANAYVAAIDLEIGKVLWRTAPGVVNGPFSVFGEALVTATTNHGRSSLVLHRLGDGQVLQTTPLTEVANTLGWDSRGVLYVASANNKKQFFQVK